MKEIRKSETCPPTTATEGRASQSDKPSPPWSPKTVHARWILLMRPIKLVIVAILGSDEDECMNVDFRSKNQREWEWRMCILKGRDNWKTVFGGDWGINAEMLFSFSLSHSHLSYFHHFRVIYLLLFLWEKYKVSRWCLRTWKVLDSKNIYMENASNSMLRILQIVKIY
jgi:hypothetical protein